MRLPETIEACLFDMDGVLTDTARIHAAAWKATFDAVLAVHGDPRPFDHEDYLAHVDGRPRADGVRALLASRGIVLPEGAPDDPPGDATVNAVGNRKNEQLLAVLARDGVDAYPGSVAFLDAVEARGVRTAVVSSSANARAALEAAGIGDRFDAWVEGTRIGAEHLAGKPAPDTFLRAAADLDVPPERCAVFEDAIAGVQAGRAGGFGLVVGVDRGAGADALRDHGADVVVADLAELSA